MTVRNDDPVELGANKGGRRETFFFFKRRPNGSRNETLWREVGRSGLGGHKQSNRSRPTVWSHEPWVQRTRSGRRASKVSDHFIFLQRRDCFLVCAYTGLHESGEHRTLTVIRTFRLNDNI